MARQPHALESPDHEGCRTDDSNPSEGITAWARTRMTNGFLEALNGLLQAAKRKARGYRRWSTLRAIIFLIAGKLDFRTLNPHAA